jgi:hypothetical protein
MSGFKLENEDAERIMKELPDLGRLRKHQRLLNPGVITTSFRIPPTSNFPIAAVCFSDTISTSADVGYALSEALSNKIWYCERRPEPLPETAIWMETFYLTDAAIRLYSAAEHLANGIIYMLDLTDEDLKKFRKAKTSQQIIVGKYLMENQKDSPVTHAVLKLKESKDWDETIRIRTDTIHNQPPTVEGLGLIYTRKNRWTQSEDGSLTTGIGGGDEPQYSIGDMENSIRKAFAVFLEVAERIIEIYAEMLDQRGITLEGDTVSVQIP